MPASNTLLEVNLSQNRVSDRAAEALARAKHLQNLLVLRLKRNAIRDMAPLAASPLGKRLLLLEMIGARIPLAADHVQKPS